MVKKIACLLAVAALAVPAFAGGSANLFTDTGSFDTAVNNAGSILTGVEDFESSNVPFGGLASPLADPLQAGVSNVDGVGGGFPTGLSLDAIQLQSNFLDAFADVPSPGQGLAVLNGFLPGQTSNVAGAFTFAESTDIIVSAADQNAIGFEVQSNTAGGGHGSGFGIRRVRYADSAGCREWCRYPRFIRRCRLGRCDRSYQHCGSGSRWRACGQR